MSARHIDHWIAIHGDHSYHFASVLGASGTVDKVALPRMLNDPLYVEPIPKSLDRKEFDLKAVAHFSAVEGAATSTAFAAKAVAIGLDMLPAKAKRLPIMFPKTTELGSPLIGGHLVLPRTKSVRRVLA